MCITTQLYMHGMNGSYTFDLSQLMRFIAILNTANRPLTGKPLCKSTCTDWHIYCNLQPTDTTYVSSVGMKHSIIQV